MATPYRFPSYASAGRPNRLMPRQKNKAAPIEIVGKIANGAP
jgi:hypothetical protein